MKNFFCLILFFVLITVSVSAKYYDTVNVGYVKTSGTGPGCSSTSSCYGDNTPHVTKCIGDNENDSGNPGEQTSAVKMGASPVNGSLTAPAGPTYVAENGTLDCFSWDGQEPVSDDITSSLDTLPYYFANNSQNIVINSGQKGGAPIVLIEGKIENINNPLVFELESTTSSSLNANVDISNVDSDRNGNNYREYTFTVTKVCDKANNCTNDIKDFVYKVYAQNINSTQSSVSGNSNFQDQIADGSEKTLTIILKDIYGNNVIPVDKSNGDTLRDIELTANFDNSLYLDQYSLSGDSGVEVSEFDGGIPLHSAGATESSIITDVSNNDGAYVLKFEVYSPTTLNGSTDGRHYAQGSFEITSIVGKTEVTGDVVITNTPLNFEFKPIYYTDISGELDESGSGFLEGVVQTGSLVISKNGVLNPDASLFLVQTGSSISTDPNSNNYFTGSGIIDTLGVDNPNTLIEKNSGLGSSFINTFNSTGNYIIKTLFFLTDMNGYIDDIKNLVVEQYIRYTLNGKNVVYRSSILNDLNSQSFETLKIYGITNIDTDKQQDLVSGQDQKDIQNLDGYIEKSSLKRDLRKNAVSTVKFVVPDNGGNKIDDLTGSDWSLNDDGRKLGNILYFESGVDNVILDNGNYSNSDIQKLEGKKTIVIKGKNLYIKSNVVNRNVDDILGIIVLQDENGNGGKVYIDPSVQEIDAIIYADKSLIGYSEIYTGNEIDGYANTSMLRNQLYILGSVFSENTIGGSRKTPPVCPFWTDVIVGFNCDNVEAQKYDLNYLRLGTDNKYNSTYVDYPVVIKYNSAVQSTPPPLFGK